MTFARWQVLTRIVLNCLYGGKELDQATAQELYAKGLSPYQAAKSIHHRQT